MRTIRLLAIIEATSITGPAKNLLSFASMAHSGEFEPLLQVSVISFQRGGGSNLFIDTVRGLSIPIYPVTEKGRFDRAVLRQLTGLVSELQPDVIQTHAVKSHLLLRLTGLEKKTPWVAFHHGYTWPDVRARMYNQLDRWSLPAAHRVVTVSLPFRAEMIQMGVSPQRIEVIHNAIDPQWGAPARRAESSADLRNKLGISADKKILLIVGRLSKEKDHETLLRSLCNLKDRYPRIHLLVVGAGVERPRIEATIRQLALTDSVTLIGQVPSSEPYYGIADISVLSSLSEGSPNALLESMATRVPVVATSVGGIPEIVVDGESALLVKPRDTAAMTHALSNLLQDEALGRRLADNAYRTVAEKYLPESRTRRLIELYGRVTTQTLESAERAG